LRRLPPLRAGGFVAIQRVLLDDQTVVTVPVALNRVTTINFPGPIEAIDGAGFTVDGKTPGLFQLAHAKGSAFFSVRALAPKASANLNVRWHDRTYVFELAESAAPVLSLNLELPPSPAEVGRAPEVSPLKLLALLDKAKAFPLLKSQQPKVSPMSASPLTTANAGQQFQRLRNPDRTGVPVQH